MHGLQWPINCRVEPSGLGGLKEFIPAGKLGSFESHVCFAAHTPLRMEEDGSTRLYYMGGNGPHSGARNSSFGLATLPPDRFAGLAASTAAHAVSKPVLVTGKTLMLTLDATATSDTGAFPYNPQCAHINRM